MNLLEIIKRAEEQKAAVGHFNVSNLEMVKAVSRVARRLDLPVIIGVSEGEREYFGVHHIRDLITSYNKEHAKGNHVIFLNADHTYSLEKLKEAAEAGFDAAVFDKGKVSFGENIQKTKEAVRIAKKANPEIVVEGELGYIGSGSKVLKELPRGAAIKPEDLTSVEDAEKFVKETGVDMLAPAVGNIHGMLAKAKNPALGIKRIHEIKKAVKIPLVLHGGSGISDDDFTAAIKAGISVIHISTELRIAWRKELGETLKENPDEVASYKIMPSVLEKIEKVVEKRLKLFNGI
jgi:fructose-bisphosphate aldolase class II